MSADPACRAPVPPEGAVPRTCVPFAHVPAVPVVAVPYVPVPVPSGLPVLSVAGILPDRTGNVDVTRFLEEWAAGTLADKADKAAPAAAGNLASLDESGNLLDSGATPASIARSAAEAVVANAPGTMDTLKEIADILGSAQQSGTVLKRISDLEEGKAPAQHVHDASHVTSGTFAPARIPPLNASKITSGTFDADRIPPLATKKIVSGTFDADRIPPLNASKITSGTFSAARLPFSVDETLATQGDAADAKAVGDALRGGFTPWEFSGLPAGVSVETVVYSEPTWSVFLSDGTAGSWELPQTALLLDGAEAQSPPGKEPPPSGFTATRHLITPTKTSQLENDGAPNGGGTPYATTEQIPDVTGKADKAANATAGNLASLDSSGNLADSGAKPSDFATKADLPYRLVTPGEWEFSDGGSYTMDGPFEAMPDEPSTPYYWKIYHGLTELDSSISYESTSVMSVEFPVAQITATRASLPGHLLDRAVNAVSVTGATELTLPALVNAGKARDFLVRLEISGSTVPTITFRGQGSETITYETDGDEFPVPDEEGTWLYAFTETAEHTFAVALKKVNTVAQGGA